MKKLILLIFFFIGLYSFGYQIEENFTGQVVKKYSDGKIHSMENFKEGKLNGEVKEFYPKGNLSQIAKFKNGELQEIKVFYESGQVKFEQRIKERKGKYRAYYENGQLEEEGEVFQGEEIGLWKYYNQEGKLISEGLYKDGKKVGEWKFYNFDGKLLKIETYQ